jgi:hypothetical protein
MDVGTEAGEQCDGLERRAVTAHLPIAQSAITCDVCGAAHPTDPPAGADLVDVSPDGRWALYDNGGDLVWVASRTEVTP